MGFRGLWAGATVGALIAGGAAALPLAAQASGSGTLAPDPDCIGSFSYVADQAQTCVVPGDPGMSRTRMMGLSVQGAGGGGGYNGGYSKGGDAALILMQVAAPAGGTLALYVARGGVASDNDKYGDGGGGGGSSAVVANGSVLAEAGGGGGGTNYEDNDGGDAGVGPDGTQGADGTSDCAGKGGNQNGDGAGGAGGPLGSACNLGPAGYPVSGQAGTSGLGGNGGDGGATEGQSAVPDSGGWGYASGGNAGQGHNSPYLAAGAGGGGGYGGGGGGAADGVYSDDGQGAGGGGGSYVDSTLVPSFGIFSADGTGGYEATGENGVIEFNYVGPSAVTRAKAPKVAATSATTHSFLNPENAQGPGFQWTRVAYSTDPTLKTGVKTVTGNPASTGSGTQDIPITADLTGLTSGTKYCYQIQGKLALTRSAQSPKGAADEPNVVGAVECFTTAAAPTPTPTPTPKPDGKKKQKPVGKNALPKSVKRSGKTVLAPAGAKTNAGQRLRTRVRCVPLKSATAGQVRYCSVNRKANGKVTLITFGRSVRVIVVQTAAPTSKVRRYHKRTVFTVRA